MWLYKRGRGTKSHDTFFFQDSTAMKESLSTVENAKTQTWAPVYNIVYIYMGVG